jgi:hypothetical protein
MYGIYLVSDGTALRISESHMASRHLLLSVTLWSHIGHSLRGEFLLVCLYSTCHLFLHHLLVCTTVNN